MVTQSVAPKGGGGKRSQHGVKSNLKCQKANLHKTMVIMKKIWRVIQNKTKIQVNAGKLGAVRQKIPGLELGFCVLVLVFK